MLFQIKVNEQEDYTGHTVICNVLIKVIKNTQYTLWSLFFLQFNFYNKIKRTTFSFPIFLLKVGQVGKPNFFHLKTKILPESTPTP